MADQLGRLLEPYPIALLFVRFLWLDAPAPAPLPLTRHRQRADVLVWCNLTSVASTGPIFKCRKIVNFVMSMSGRNRRPHTIDPEEVGPGVGGFFKKKKVMLTQPLAL